MELTLNLPPDFSPENPLIIREGRAPDIEIQQQVYQECQLSSLASFIKGRHVNQIPQNYVAPDQILSPGTSIIIIDEQAAKIEIKLDPEKPKGTVIIGRLEESEDLKKFQVNKDQTFTREGLVKLLRFSRRFFKSTEKHEALLRAFMALDISSNTNLVTASDTRANKTVNFEKRVDAKSLPLDFLLHIEIFKGLPAASVRIDICFDTSENTVRFWLESPELQEIKDDMKARAIKEITDLLDGFVLLYK